MTLRLQNFSYRFAEQVLNSKLSLKQEIESVLTDPCIFITKFGKPMGPRGFQNVVKKYLEETNIKNASVHTLRHTFATLQIKNGTI